MHAALIELLTLAMAAVVFVPLFRYLGLGAILAYLFAGIVIGPDVLALIKDTQEILHISELGIVFLLFVIGLELAPRKLWLLRRSIFGMGFLQVALTGTLFTGLGYLMGLPIAAAYIAGFGLALSSTAFSIQILEDSRQLNTTHGQGAFAILMFQDLAVVPIIASLAFFSASGVTAPDSYSLIKIAVVFLGLILFGHFLLRHVLRLIADSHTQEVFTAMTLLIVIGTALLMESIGLSMGMGAFFAGVLLANSEYRHELETNLLPFKGLLLGLFFMAVGMSLDLNVLAQQPHWIALLALAFMTTKGLLIYCLARFFRFPKEASRNMGFILPQGGEFAFVLFSVALAQGLMTPEHSSLLSASVTISMALTPFIFSFNQKYLRRFTEISERPYDSIAPQDVEVIVAGYGRIGQIISRFLNAEKVVYTILDHNASQVDTARKFGGKVYYGDASRQDILESAGARKAKYFILAIADPILSVKTAKLVRDKFPHMEIIARARDRQHALNLMEVGVGSIYRETYMTSLEVAKDVMLRRGRSPESVENALKNFRIHDEKILVKQYDIRHDEKKLISFTSRANKELESILMEDQSSPVQTDTET
jgi:monovalent cation:proton antiporter-2 (CPA2) family protein